ncbi:hypothetical protein FSARC_3041 [Fusarium sarcochroum]|uniref:Zn(2)-C6 fungal-type domain-containing protein n=1 Tax=Fusarium sarcochroum TaxID=1208366 RepID=A0A8H4U4Q9_9HYPO|nr:hypothetical protein FSARC_3041 [Fusarium sarcochroum]
MESCQRRRAGCTECRRKKAKCDEKKPTCTRCAKCPNLCSYELSIKATKFKTPKHERVLTKPSTGRSSTVGLHPQPPEAHSVFSPGKDYSSPTLPSTEDTYASLPVVQDVQTSLVTYSPGQDLLTPTPTLTISYLPPSLTLQSDPRKIYYQHFVVHTATVYFPLQPDAALSLVIPAAENSPCMLGAMVAASSSQYFRLRGNPDSRNAAIMATMESLASLREAITTPAFGSHGVAILPTTLMLATTCVCAGDTATFRKHLNGALHIVRRDRSRHSLEPLWWLSLKWLVHLLLMNRLSGLPLPTRQRKGFVDWDYLLTCMPDLGRIDPATGFSRELVAALDAVCELSEPCCEEIDDTDQCSEGSPNSGKNPADQNSHQDLEKRLIKLRGKCASTIHDMAFRTELESSHRLFTNATLLCLYRRVYGLPKDHQKVQMAVDSTIESLERIDKQSRVHAQLLWPLLAAGCESTTGTQQSVITERMQAMTAQGMGSYENVLEFMRDYWKDGGDMRWDVFARQTGKDLVLF